MPASEYMRKLFKILEQTHSDTHHSKLLVVLLVWMFFWAVFYGFQYGEDNIQGDLVHQINTALSLEDPKIFIKDYIYSDPNIMAFYSPQQIWSIRILYRLTGSMSVGLAILQFFYSAFCVLGAWLVAKKVTQNVWIMLVFILTILQFSMIPLKGGWSWGLLRGPIPVFMPMNWIFARGLLLVFIALLLSKRQYAVTAQAATLGVLFTIHPPTGLTLAMGTIPYFIWKLIASSNKTKDLIKWVGVFLTGASFFLFNYYWTSSPNSTLFTPAENAFLYDFWQYRFPDDYPHVIWRLFTLGDLKWDWVAHTALIMVTLSALWGVIEKNGAILLASTSLLLGYIYGFAAIPLAIFILWVSFRDRENLKLFQTSTWSLALITFGAFFVTTWLQWAYDIYNTKMQTPPFLVDNMRFISFLFPFAFVLFTIATRKSKKWGLLIATYGILTLPLIFHFVFDPIYQNFASTHNVKVRAKYDFSTHFSLSKSDHNKVVEFAKSSPNDSLFLFLAAGHESWYFRLRARRSLAINSSDLGLLYYNAKHKLINDWLIYTNIQESYKNRDIGRLCEAIKGLAIDFIVFPKVQSTNLLCLDIALEMDSGTVYSRNGLSR